MKPIGAAKLSPRPPHVIAAVPTDRRVPTAAFATAVMADVTRIQARHTRELRVEDGIAGVALAVGGGLVVTLKPGQPYAQANIERAVKNLCAQHGLADARVTFAS